MFILDIARKGYTFIARSRYKKNNVLDETSIIGLHTKLYHSRIGYHSACNKYCNLASTSIGNYTQLGQFVRVNPRDHIYQNFMISDDIYLEHEENFDKGLKDFDGYDVKIGHDVWVGERSIILSHVEIGNGAIIAAGSVVTKSVASYMIVGGVPARFIKWRFPQNVRKQLEKTEWFYWPIEKVIEHKNDLEKICGFNIDEYKVNYLVQKKMLRDNNTENGKISENLGGGIKYEPDLIIRRVRETALAAVQ